MFNYFQAFDSPAIKTQIDAQLSLAIDISYKILDGAQKINALNLQVMIALYRESLMNTQQLFSAPLSDKTALIIDEKAPPAIEKMRAYQQHLQTIFAEAQAGMAATLEAHLPETVRAAEDVANEVLQNISAETIKAMEPGE